MLRAACAVLRSSPSACGAASSSAAAAAAAGAAGAAAGTSAAVAGIAPRLAVAAAVGSSSSASFYPAATAVRFCSSDAADGKGDDEGSADEAGAASGEVPSFEDFVHKMERSVRKDLRKNVRSRYFGEFGDAFDRAGVDITPTEWRRAVAKGHEFWDREEENPRGQGVSWSPLPVHDAFSVAEMERESTMPSDEALFDWDNRDLQNAPVTNAEMVTRTRGGLKVHYCVFCYHGTEQLKPENTALLSKMISDTGRVLPKRITACCSKHQRKLAHTVKRARQLQLLPYNQRLHPRLRATSFTPDPNNMKPVRFTTPRELIVATKAFKELSRSRAVREGGRQVAPQPRTDWFPDEA